MDSMVGVGGGGFFNFVLPKETMTDNVPHCKINHLKIYLLKKEYL